MLTKYQEHGTRIRPSHCTYFNDRPDASGQVNVKEPPKSLGIEFDSATA
jgi:hypothetical protein